MMLSSHFKEAFPSSCHYCTFWSVRRAARPTPTPRLPRVPKTSKGILLCRQFSGINVPVEKEPDVTVQEPPVRALEPEPEILVSEAENILESVENSEPQEQIDGNAALSGQNDAPEVVKSQEEATPPGTEEGDSTFGLLEDHVYRPSVSSRSQRTLTPLGATQPSSLCFSSTTFFL